jgi:nucleoside-diphosphate-sugar epimerase
MARSSTAVATPPAPVKPHMVILGMGFTGSRFARACLANGWTVTGTSRDSDAVAPRVGANVARLIGPGSDAEALDSAIANATHILATAPVDRSTGTDPFIQLHARALGHAAVRGRVQWAGYLSTTSVYGDHNGDWVDEDMPTHPSLKRGVLRVNAEYAWRATGLPLHVFRLPGIYGPGRGPLPRVRSGTAKSIVKAGQMFSRIHVDDIVGTLMASVASPNPGRIYNVCDDEPAPTHEVSETAESCSWMNDVSDIRT